MAIALPGAIAALLLTALAWASYATLDDSARKTFVAKDVVADILPPPMYLIEMRLVLSQAIEQTIKPDEARKEFERLAKDYDVRVAYWTQNPPYGLQAKLLGAQHAEGRKFIALARSEIIDRLAKGDLHGARTALPAVHAAYQAHRAGVDDTVASGNEFAESSAALFDSTGQRGRWVLVSVAALLLTMMGVMSLLALRRIVASVQRGVALARTIAAGDLTAQPAPASNDELGQLQQAMLQMQGVLRELIDQQTEMARQHIETGNLGARIALTRFEGSYRRMAEGVNDMVSSHVALTEHIVDLVGQYGQGHFAATMEDLPGDKARVTRAVRSVQQSLKDGADRAAFNLRIRTALDVAETNVMLTDADDRVLYQNQSLLAMFGRNQAALRAALPGFDARALIGEPLSPLLQAFGHARGLTGRLQAQERAKVVVAGLTFEMVFAPVVTASGGHGGTVIEWADRSAEVAVEQDLAAIVDAAAAGDFGQRFELEGKDAFFRQIGVALNRLLDTTADGLGDMTRVLGALAQGNLTQRIETEYSGTFGLMKDDANLTVTQLAQIIGEIREATETIHTAAIEIASGNLNLSQRTEQQASSLEETAATIEQLTATVKQNADSARQANELATTASAVALKGGHVVSEVVATMTSITDSSKQIVDIISVIDGIAFQTNILALNAAVEAARAGEQGRGFAVVAGEVRSLAQRSAAAAKEIKTLIGTSVDKVEAGSRLVTAAGQTMQDIVSSVKRVTDIMGEISAASVEQSSGIEQVNQAVGLMDQATQQNAALVEQAAAAAESMKAQAANLAQSVGVFTLER